MRDNSQSYDNLIFMIFLTWCRLGFGGSAVTNAAASPHPGDQSTLVIFVIGGISYKEVGQVQALLDLHRQQQQQRSGKGGAVGGSGKIILLSTKTINPENIFHLTYSD